MSALLAKLAASGHVRRADRALGEWVARSFPDAAPEIALAAALAARAVADGHSALELARAQSWVEGLEGTGRAPTLPAPDDWLAILRAAPPGLPIVCDAQGRVYLRRYYDYERRLATALIARAVASPDSPIRDTPSPPTAASLGERAFSSRADGEMPGEQRVGVPSNDAQNAPHPSPPPRAGEGEEQARGGNKRRTTSRANVLSPRSRGEMPAGQRGGTAERATPVDPEQQRAIDAALTHQLTLITGGPGTGKTWSVVRMLVALVTRTAADGSPLRIALAAPTGKAAARLLESVQAQLASLDLPADIRAQMPAEAQTVHRLLGLSPWRNAPKFDRGTPLPFGVVVVDEVSMVDLPLMVKLVDAVAPAARLILLGDPEQLAAVEAGDVLGALRRAADDGASPLHACHAPLTVNHRFGAGSALGRLADAITRGDADGAIADLQGDGADARLADPDLRRVVADAAEAYTPVIDAASPVAALDAARRFRVLTALRHGPSGCIALDHAIGASLRRRHGLSPDAPWCRGRLVLITVNRPELGLYNGDTGVVFPDPEDPHHPLKAWFTGAGGQPRGFAPAALPPHEGAFALTVHKAQGSEFECVALVTGPESAVLTRELLYTGVTRARSALTLYANPEVLREGIARRTLRMSGLADRLREIAAQGEM